MCYYNVISAVLVGQIVLFSGEVLCTGFWRLRGWVFVFRVLCGAKEGWEMHERYLGSGETRWVGVLCVIITLSVQF